jgi:hypothetical protein
MQFVRPEIYTNCLLVINRTTQFVRPEIYTNRLQGNKGRRNLSGGRSMSADYPGGNV